MLNAACREVSGAVAGRKGAKDDERCCLMQGTGSGRKAEALGMAFVPPKHGPYNSLYDLLGSNMTPGVLQA